MQEKEENILFGGSYFNRIILNYYLKVFIIYCLYLTVIHFTLN